MRQYTFHITSDKYTVNTRITVSANNYFEAREKIKEIIIQHACPDPKPTIKLVKVEIPYE